MVRDDYYTELLDDPAMKIARLGLEAQKFLTSNLGRELIQSAEADIERAYQALAIADPEDSGTIRARQFDIAVARYLPHWIDNVIRQGLEAERQIELEESE